MRASPRTACHMTTSRAQTTALSWAHTIPFWASVDSCASMLPLASLNALPIFWSPQIPKSACVYWKSKMEAQSLANTHSYLPASTPPTGWMAPFFTSVLLGPHWLDAPCTFYLGGRPSLKHIHTKSLHGSPTKCAYPHFQASLFPSFAEEASFEFCHLIHTLHIYHHFCCVRLCTPCVLFSCGCCNELSQSGSFEQQIYFLTVLMTRHPKSVSVS